MQSIWVPYKMFRCVLSYIHDLSLGNWLETYEVLYNNLILTPKTFRSILMLISLQKKNTSSIKAKHIKVNLT